MKTTENRRNKMREYRAGHKETMYAQTREWIGLHPEKIHEYNVSRAALYVEKHAAA